MPENLIKQDIRSLSKDELKLFFTEQGEQAYRAQQVYEWLWQKSARSFEEMSNLSKDQRAFLSENFDLNAMTVSDVQESEDGTIKSGFKLFDGNLIEGVLIPTEKRMTACISSQVGCSLSCKFCATGFLERKRNLSPAEIYDQVVLIKNQAEEKYEKPLTNIVMMGMGEPLLNYHNVLGGIQKINSKEGLGMAAKRITLSTAGIAKMIRRLGDDKVRFKLALSLHAATDEKRDKIMPINEENNIEALIGAIDHYFAETKNHITFEYILFDGFNDSREDAEQLARLCRRVPAKVNLIEYNQVDGVQFKKPSEEKTDAFADTLKAHHITAKIRRSRGKDIDAACGQLANKKS